MNAASVSSFPKRKLMPRELMPELDGHGFLAPHQKADGFDAFLDRQLVLIVAPPWLGKSFVSKQLKRHFDNMVDTPDKSGFGQFVHRTDFERESHDELLPTWWPDWLASPERALWIVDAIDEDARKGLVRSHRLLNILARIEPEKRSRLCCLMFARENEVPKKFEDRLQEIYGEPDADEGGKYCILRLAPLDWQSARELLRNDETTYRRVRHLIVHNHLQSLAGYPSAVERLSSYPHDRVVDDVQVWKDVLIELIKDKNADEVTRLQRSSPNLQFDAAARLAVILTFSDCDVVGEADGYSNDPGIDALIRPDHFESQALNRAGREVLLSGIFRRSVRGFQFAQHHVQQWLAAFGAASLSLTRLRPLVTDDAGKMLPVHRGTLGLLVRTTTDAAVKDWIVEQHGGVPPRSDAAPWSLSQSVDALDRLQTIVKTTPWGLSFWHDRGLQFLATQNLGAELARRLGDRSLVFPEQQLIIEAAIATGSTEVIPMAMRISLDDTANAHLRDYAATLVITLGGKDDLVKLATQLSKSSQHGAARDAIKANTVYQLYERGFWDYSTALREAPPPGSRTGLLYYRLQKDMTVDNARQVVGMIDLDRLTRELAAPHRHRGRSDWIELVTKAIKLIADQDHLQPSDYELLLPIAVAQHRPDWQSHDLLGLARVVARDRETRRSLISSVLSSSPEGKQPITWQFISVVVTEDLEWLVTLAADDNGRHPWLWRRILQVASWTSTPHDIRERVRAKAREFVPALLQQVDEEQALAEEHERQIERREEDWKRQSKVQSFELKELVDDALDNPQIPLCEKMHRLSWFCLSDAEFRPTNVIGTWDNLDPERQRRVLAECRRALHECEPTHLPNANSYSGAIVSESTCFARITDLCRESYVLDGRQIERWLQSTLAISTSHDDSLVSRCHLADPAATERVLVKELNRCLSFQPQSIFFLDALPPAIWTDQLCRKFVEVATNDDYALAGRTALLRRLSQRNEDCTIPILRRWITDPNQDKRLVAVDVLLPTDPELAWDEFRKQIHTAGKDTFLKLDHILAEPHGLNPALSSWKAELIEELHAMLMWASPRLVGAPGDQVRLASNASGLR